MVWRGAALQRPYLPTIRVANGGNREIEDTDYLRPLVVHIPGAVIVNIETVDALGPALTDVTYDVDHDFLQLSDLLLNIHDYLVFQMLVDGRDTATITADCRLRGETQPIQEMRTRSDIDPVGLYQLLGDALPWPVGGFFRRAAIVMDYPRSPKRPRID